MIPITTFLSYADSDKAVAHDLVNFLKDYNFEVFVAHDDIHTGEDWAETLKNEIHNRELFLVLLSENFKNASFTNHEVGVAIAYNKRIFSVIIDNSTPYGFMAKFQGKKINPRLILNELHQLVNELLRFSDAGKKGIDILIEQLLDSKTWAKSNEITRKLFEYTVFTPDQINNIASAYIKNTQVSGSYLTEPRCKEFLKKNWSDIKPEFQKKLSDMIQKKVKKRIPEI